MKDRQTGDREAQRDRDDRDRNRSGKADAPEIGDRPEGRRRASRGEEDEDARGDTGGGQQAMGPDVFGWSRTPARPTSAAPPTNASWPTMLHASANVPPIARGLGELDRLADRRDGERGGQHDDADPGDDRPPNMTDTNGRPGGDRDDEKVEDDHDHRPRREVDEGEPAGSDDRQRDEEHCLAASPRPAGSHQECGQ